MKPEHTLTDPITRLDACRSPRSSETAHRSPRRRYRTARLIQKLPSNRNQIGIEIIGGET